MHELKINFSLGEENTLLASTGTHTHHLHQRGIEEATKIRTHALKLAP